jgi:hypothetical protein
MSVEHSVDTPSLEERSTSLTHVAEWALSRYGLGEARPVLLDDSTNMLFRILPLGQQYHADGDEAETADNAGFVLRIHAIGQHSTQAIHEELQWLLAIRRETALIVPVPVPARDGARGLSERHTDAKRPARRGGVHGSVTRPREPVCLLANTPTHAASPVL